MTWSNKRTLRLRWSCSDCCHHDHRWKFTATICGQLQRLWRWEGL